MINSYVPGTILDTENTAVNWQKYICIDVETLNKRV